MLKRYKVHKSGKRETTAHIYTANEHPIDNSMLDRDAIKIIEKLKRSGYEAYIVGGAVRDLLVGKQPKDFDIATSAYPKQIRKLFWNSRIIGRRFKLAHIYFQEKIFEVSTFRSADQGELGEHNIYGTIEEDAARRDFTINSLYYDPLENQIFDFRNAMHDIQEGRIRSIIPLSVTFIEDPVRMIRCIKYAVTTEFTITFRLKRAIRKYAPELKRCSSSRITEEVFKILQGGCSVEIVKQLISYGLFQNMLPLIAAVLSKGKKTSIYSDFFQSMNELDADINQRRSRSGAQSADPNHGDLQRSSMLVYLIDPLLSFPEEYENSHELFKDVFKQIKQLITPLTPPNYEVEKSVEILFKRAGIKVPKNAVRKPKPITNNQAGGGQQRRGRKSASARKRTNRNRIKPQNEIRDRGNTSP